RATRRRTSAGAIYARPRCISSGIQNLTVLRLSDIGSGSKTGEARECSGPSRSTMWWTRFGVIYSPFESERDPLRLHKDWWNHLIRLAMEPHVPESSFVIDGPLQLPLPDRWRGRCWPDGRS